MSRSFARAIVFAAAALALAACQTARVPEAKLLLNATSFASIDGWKAGDARPAVTAFLRSCAALMSRGFDQPMGGLNYAGRISDWSVPCTAARQVPQSDPAAAQAFFEVNFVPYAVGAEPPSNGLFTGYYEPLLHGSRLQHDQYQTPLYALPPGYTAPNIPRAEIVKNGAPLPVLCYVDDKIDAFFLQIQGSGRVQLDDGTTIRAGYAGQNGFPYTAVGAVLLGRGEIPREQMSMQAIRNWMMTHPEQADALMDMNQSFVFFIEKPVVDSTAGADGADHTALTPTASIAVDRSIHPLGLPMWIDTEAPVPNADAMTPLHRLFVAQDTGGAIKGPVRADVYWGFGPEAADVAGRMKSQGHLTVLLPLSVAAKIGARLVLPIR